jgi:hypothetical protein
MSEDAGKTRIVKRDLSQFQAPIEDEASDPDKTRKLKRDETGTYPINSDSRLYEDKTAIASSAQEQRLDSEGRDDKKTRLVGPRRAERNVFDPLAPKNETPETASDPVVGWLVIVKGPGRGNALQIGYGFNSIGRDASQRIRLDFGDAQISRLNHAKLLYEPRARNFKITLGDGVNPTYVRGEVLLAPTELNSGDRVMMGETELLFIALCGEKFDWQDDE